MKRARVDFLKFQIGTGNNSGSVLVTTSTGLVIKSAPKEIKKKKKAPKILAGYTRRRRRLTILRRNRHAINVNENKVTNETSATENDGDKQLNLQPMDDDDLRLGESNGRSQRVRKMVQPYMHQVSPKGSGKNVDANVGKLHINPIHLKQQQIKVTNVRGGINVNKTPMNTILNHFQVVSPSSRNKRRINYSEDLDDEAFMYEEMLFNTRKSKKSSPSTQQQQAKIKAIDEAVKMLGNEITLVPLSSKRNSSINNNNSSCSSTSSSGSNSGKKLESSQSNLSLDANGQRPNWPISIYQKPSTTQPSTSHIKISEIKSLCPKESTQIAKSPPKICKFCKTVFAGEKQLAIHQLKHLTIAAVKVDKVNILSAHHRRVSSAALQIMIE